MLSCFFINKIISSDMTSFLSRLFLLIVVITFVLFLVLKNSVFLDDTAKNNKQLNQIDDLPFVETKPQTTPKTKPQTTPKTKPQTTPKTIPFKTVAFETDSLDADSFETDTFDSASLKTDLLKTDLLKTDPSQTKTTSNVTDDITPSIVLNGQSENTESQSHNDFESGVIQPNSQDGYQNDYQNDKQDSQNNDQNNQTNPDNTLTDSPPVITIIGKHNVDLLLDKPYVELGANALDEEDGILEVTILGVVNTQILGKYQLVYSATDSKNQITQITRTVNVITNLFSTIWKTDNAGGSANNQITLEVNKTYQYNYTVDWGDGQSDTQVRTNITHTYAQPGQYQVLISGLYPGPYFSSTPESDAKKLLSVENWGDNKWQTMYRAFNGCENMVINASDTPDLSLVKNMNRMFASAHNVNQYIGHWDVSNVKNMSRMFFIASKFNQDLSAWDVSNVENMESMFRFASSFNQDISTWNVSKVTDMNGMFLEADNFNQEIGRWNISLVKRFDYMFAGADRFNQDLGDWDLQSVNDLRGMFSGTEDFNQDLNQWDLSKVKYISSMFQGAKSFNGDISAWQFDAVTSLNSMFKGAQSFNNDISGWDVSAITQMKTMFKDAVKFKQDLSLWDISNVTDMALMFNGLTLTTHHYDALLSSWANQITQQNVVFDAGDSQYTKGSLAQTARQTLTDTLGWTITDGGAKQY
ncbi:MAG: BspA family leucine-rich repeat surface protein [Saccharospirillaceae bacterium]|nr:BspA family leucine-rich repeat surface protein [Saccharospirillaceae bacterium]